MVELKQTETFRKWRTRLKDGRARALIASRLDRLAFGHTGDVEPVGQGINELRIHYGSGYRIYFQRRGSAIIILLYGGNKRTQAVAIQLTPDLSDNGVEKCSRTSVRCAFPPCSRINQRQSEQLQSENSLAGLFSSPPTI